MAIICDVGFDTAAKYKGKSLKAPYGKKKQSVYLKVHADDSNLQECIELAKQSKNVLMVSYQGTCSWEVYPFLANLRGVYVGCTVGDFGLDVSEEDIVGAVEDVPDGVTPIISLPKSYTDVEFLWRVSQRYPQIRFTGGNLFAVNGLKVGEIGVDTLESSGIKTDASQYVVKDGVDVLESADFSELEIDASGKESSSSTRSKSTTPKSSKPKQVDNIKSRIGALFANSDFQGL